MPKSLMIVSVKMARRASRRPLSSLTLDQKRSIEISELFQSIRRDTLIRFWSNCPVVTIDVRFRIQRLNPSSRSQCAICSQ